jgi:hypothetical protein
MPAASWMWSLTEHRYFAFVSLYEGVSKSFRTGSLGRELQMVQLSATSCICITILWVSIVSFAAITLYVASQRVFIVVYFVIDSVRKLMDTPSYIGSQVLKLSLHHSSVVCSAMDNQFWKKSTNSVTTVREAKFPVFSTLAHMSFLSWQHWLVKVQYGRLC